MAACCLTAACLSLCLYALTFTHHTSPLHATAFVLMPCFAVVVVVVPRGGMQKESSGALMMSEDEDDDCGLHVGVLGMLLEPHHNHSNHTTQTAHGKPLSFRADRDPGGIVFCALPPFGPLARGSPLAFVFVFSHT